MCNYIYTYNILFYLVKILSNYRKLKIHILDNELYIELYNLE